MQIKQPVKPLSQINVGVLPQSINQSYHEFHQKLSKNISKTLRRSIAINGNRSNPKSLVHAVLERNQTTQNAQIHTNR